MLSHHGAKDNGSPRPLKHDVRNGTDVQPRLRTCVATYRSTWSSLGAKMPTGAIAAAATTAAATATVTAAAVAAAAATAVVTAVTAATATAATAFKACCPGTG